MSFFINQELGNLEAGGVGVSGGVTRVLRVLDGEKLSFSSYRLRISLESIQTWELL